MRLILISQFIFLSVGKAYSENLTPLQKAAIKVQVAKVDQIMLRCKFEKRCVAKRIRKLSWRECRNTRELFPYNSRDSIWHKCIAIIYVGLIDYYNQVSKKILNGTYDYNRVNKQHSL